MGQIERKFMANFINATPDKETTVYKRLGKDLEEYNIEMSAEVTKKNNILGETSINLSSYETQGTVEPYYADAEDELFAFLQSIVDERKTLDQVKTDTVEAQLWTGETGDPMVDNTFTAYREDVYIEISSYGGDTTGYQIPFNVHYTGKRTKGKWDNKLKTFTPDVAGA